MQQQREQLDAAVRDLELQRSELEALHVELTGRQETLQAQLQVSCASDEGS